MAEVKEDKNTEEIVPYRCYACQKYDGTFGPEKDQHTHVCAICKDLDPDATVIERHLDEDNEPEVRESALLLTCERCGNERDECFCPDNPLRRAERAIRYMAGFEDTPAAPPANTGGGGGGPAFTVTFTGTAQNAQTIVHNWNDAGPEPDPNEETEEEYFNDDQEEPF